MSTEITNRPRPWNGAVAKFIDKDGYPTKKALAVVANWPINSREDCAALLDLVVDIWWGSSRGTGLWTVRGSTTVACTGGWSGNEDLIQAMRRNTLFWTLCWQSSNRGGRHLFKLPKAGGKSPRIK